MCSMYFYRRHYLSIMQDGSTPLYVSCAKGHTEVVGTLVKGGADPNLGTKVQGSEC